MRSSMRLTTAAVVSALLLTVAVAATPTVSMPK